MQSEHILLEKDVKVSTCHPHSQARALPMHGPLVAVEPERAVLQPKSTLQAAITTTMLREQKGLMLQPLWSYHVKFGDFQDD
jgi:hypothetical protein